MSSVDDVIAAIDKAHGKGIVLKLNNSDKGLARERMSSGSLLLDRALGGGFVRGTLNEIYGLESSGKSTLCLHAMAEAQKHGLVLFVDTEYSFDPVYAKALGIDVPSLIMCQPLYAEQAFDVIEAFADCPEISMIVLDSIAALSPKAEIEGDPGDSNMGLAARLNRQHIRKITAPLSNNKIIALYTNQITYKMTGYGNPETTTGGTSFKYFASTRMKTTKTSTQKYNIEHQSIECVVNITKNKTYIPYQIAELDIDFGMGINRGSELLKLGEELGTVVKSGSWYSIGTEKIGQGKKNAAQFLLEHPEYESNILDKDKQLCISQIQKETL